MRTLALSLACLITSTLLAQGTLSVNPPQPRVDGVTAFTLNGVVPASVTWDFGDGSPTSPGGSVITHAYGAVGAFTVRATYTLALGGGLSTVQRTVLVYEPRSIRAFPANPQAGEPLVLQAQSFFASRGIAWNFGDGSAPVFSGTATTTHSYLLPGAYTVSATDVFATGSRVIQARVMIGATGPSAPFNLTYLLLHWEDGTVRRTVGRGEGGLTALADLKWEGTGLFQGQWLVDGQVFRTFSQQLAFANRLMLNSGGGSIGGTRLALPTDVPGEHTVTLRVLQPGLLFEAPVIRYFVSLGADPAGPILRNVLPSRIRAGEEVELQLSGPHLRPDMELHLGLDMAVVGPIRLVGPELVLVRVFVPPTARPGSRVLRSSLEKGEPAGTARLDILPPRKQPPD